MAGGLHEISVVDADLAAFEKILGSDRSGNLRAAAAQIRARLAGGTLWHVNSTGAGGGVAEMLHTLIPLYRALGVPARWAVVEADAEFMTIAKRLGAMLYGDCGDGGALADRERRHYLSELAGAADRFDAVSGPRDVVVLHDHQTAGLVSLLGPSVRRIYWRCHVGVDEPTEFSDQAWAFVSPMLSQAAGLLFSVPQHIPDWVPSDLATVLPPFIAPQSAKNRDLGPAAVTAALQHCGLASATKVSTGRPHEDSFSITHPATRVAETVPEPGQPLVVQVSRWDRLKDMDGVITAFTAVPDDGYLALVGPDPEGIADDIEQGHWYERAVASWHALPLRQRRRIGLVCLPMTDLDENALLVNAVQRGADLVLQKSLAEGFGLTVTEAMWKSRPVIASAVGGIRAQIAHGVNGYLIDDPADLVGFAALISASLRSPETKLAALGAAAHEEVHRSFLPDREINTTAELLAKE